MTSPAASPQLCMCCMFCSVGNFLSHIPGDSVGLCLYRALWEWSEQGREDLNQQKTSNNIHVVHPKCCPAQGATPVSAALLSSRAAQARYPAGQTEALHQ